jgi:hypothetical protein
VVRASIPTPPINGAQDNVDSSRQKVPRAQERRAQEGKRQSAPISRRQAPPAAADAKAPPQAGEPKVGRVTKQERVLTLLSRAEGASIEEMMKATDWQQHSVRGFLAGTVKRKLGFLLTSARVNDGARRYRIEAKRGR